MTTIPHTPPARPQAVITPVGQPAAASLPAPVPMSITAADVWRVIRTNLLLIIVFLILFAILGYAANVVLLRVYPRYTARGLLQIQTTVLQDPVTDKFYEMTEPRLLTEQRTQAQLLQTEYLFSTALKENENLRRTGWFQSYIQRDPTGRTPDRPDVKEAKEYLGKWFRVRPLTDSALLEVSFTCSSPKDAKVVLEELVRVHIERQRMVAAERNVAHNQALTRMKDTIDQRLAALTRRVRDRQAMLAQKGMGEVGVFSSKEAELKALVEAHLKALGKAGEAKNALERVTAQLARGETLGEVEKAVEMDPTIATLVREVVSMEIQRDSKIDSLGKGHREVEALNRMIETAKQKLESRREELRSQLRNQFLDTLKGDAAQAAADAELIAARIRDLKNELADLGKEVANLRVDEEEEKQLREQQQQIANKLRDLGQIQSAQSQSKIEWAPNGWPEEPELPSFPRLKYTLPIAIVLGLALALAVAFLREFMNETIRSPADIARVGQLALLGIVADEADDPQASGAALAIFDAPHSVIAEQFRQIRTRLHHAASLDTTRSLLVTGPAPQDGKTTVAANLAAALALNGRRILLVDANFRRPDLHRIFDLPNEHGLSDVLLDSSKLAATVRETRIPNLSVLTSGPRPANPAELFESHLFADFLKAAAESYDHVVFDSAPLLVVAEPGAMAARVDGVITVVRAHEESRGLLQRMRDTLRQLKARNLGVVLNAVRGRAGGYYRRNIRAYYNYQG